MESSILNFPDVFIQDRQRAGMSCAGEGKQRDDGEQQKVRSRAQQSRCHATLAGLFEALRNMVCPSSQSSHNCETSNERSPAKVRRTVRVGT